MKGVILMTIIERCKLADKRRNAILQLADIIRLNEQYPDDLELEQELIPLMNARLETIVKCHNELTQEREI